MKLEHIGIAVNNLEESKKIFDALFGHASYKTETVASEMVTTVFYQTGSAKIELLKSEDPTSAIAKFLEKKGEGIHHLAFDVVDIYAEIDRLTDQGFTVINEAPKVGADNKQIVFLHPKTTNGVLVELCQSINDSSK